MPPQFAIYQQEILYSQSGVRSRLKAENCAKERAANTKRTGDQPQKNGRPGAFARAAGLAEIFSKLYRKI
jgi:hypothetical protein